MKLNQLLLTAMFALPLTACDNRSEAEMGYQDGTGESGIVNERYSATEEDGINLDQDLVEQNSSRGEQDGVKIDEDVAEQRSADVGTGR